jgi:hypothetical protein
MSALSISVPYPVFSGQDGLPLDNGYVWIGTANLYPITNQIAVYFDEALTIQATQPLRTINGFISNAGTPAQVYVNAVNFSILVQDSKGSMIYNFPDGTGLSPDACGVDYDPPFTGAVPTTVCVKLAETISAQDFGATSGADTAAINDAIAYGISSGKRVQFPFSATIRVPEDAPTLQAAVNAIQPTDLGVVITINIEAGHKLTSGLIVENGDFTQFNITSTDATVLLSPSWVAGTALLTGTNARMPNWNIFVDCESKNVNTAVDTGARTVLENSTLLLGDGAGCTNGGASNNGLFVYRNSKVTGSQCVFSNFPNNNIWITHVSEAYLERITATGGGLNGAFVSRGSLLYATGGDFSEATEYGVLAFRSRVVAIPFGTTAPTKFNDCGIAGASIEANSIFTATIRSGIRPQFYDSLTHGLVVSGASLADINGSDFKNIASDAIRVDNARVNAKSCIFDAITRDVIFATGTANVSANAITATNAAGRRAVYANQGSIVECDGSNLTGAGEDAVLSETGATVTVNGSTINDATSNALHATGGNIVGLSVTATGAGSRGALADRGGFINVEGGNLSGATVGGARAIEGSRIVAVDANLQSTGSPATSDCQIVSGSIISFNGGTGGVNTTANTLTAAGIIFQ